MFFGKRAETIILPSPYALTPSGSFDGDDGKWSSFVINIGDDGRNLSNGQNFKVLISTSGSATLVPQQTEWCASDACAKDRGIMPFGPSQSWGFDISKTTRWKDAGIYNIPTPPWWTEAQILDGSKNPAAVWGVSTVGLGESSPDSVILEDQYVVKYTVGEFYLGQFGLSVGSTGPTGGGKPNFIENLYGSAHKIASRSYGYTAGAYYRNNNNGVTGSLVLGGYDKARMTDKGTTINMPSAQNTTLAVGVNSILYKPDQNIEANTISLSNKSFAAVIDSTLPYLILPDDVCEQFVEQFGLEYDKVLELYTISNSSHQANVRKSANVSWKISASADTDSDVFTSITLPYAAFDQQGKFPLFKNATKYFPIKRSKIGQFVLGRTFLQEAYIIVNYEFANFTVAPAYTDRIPDPELAVLYDKSGPPKPPDSGGGELSAGAIAGIVVGIVGAFIIAAIAAFFIWRKRRTAKKTREMTQTPSEIDTTYAGNEIKYRRVSELTGSEAAPQSPKGGYYGQDQKSIPPISEMSPESTPAELYSPPPDGLDTFDSYFVAGRMRRRGATRDRDSSGNNTPRTPIAELPGEEPIRSIPGKDTMNPLQKPPHSRSPSNTSLSTNIDEVLAKKRAKRAGVDTNETRIAVEPGEPATAEEIARATAAAQEEGAEDTEHPSTMERRPSHARGLSDTTIQSDSTAVSQPTPEELDRWARSPDDGPARPMSP